MAFMAVRWTPQVEFELTGRAFENGFHVATERNRLAASEVQRMAAELERRVQQSQHMIEQAARTVAATKARRRQLARLFE